MDITLIIELVLFVLLMLLSGFFSSSETSLFSLNKLQLEQMRRDDNHRISLIERMLSEPRRLIITILIGNEFVNVAASVISAASRKSKSAENLRSKKAEQKPASLNRNRVRFARL